MSKDTFMNRFDGERPSEPQSVEVHISSFIVYCKPEFFENVKQVLKLNPEVEVHAEDEAGKFVIVVEGDSSKRILDVVATVEQIEGVFNTAMVYHQAIDESEVDLAADQFDQPMVEPLEAALNKTESNQSVH